MGYKIIDYKNEVVKDGFKTATDAFIWMSNQFTQEHIRLYYLRVIRED